MVRTDAHPPIAQSPTTSNREDDDTGDDSTSPDGRTEFLTGSDGSSSSTNEDEDENEELEVRNIAQQQISNVSFAALKKAEDLLTRKRKRGQETMASQDAKSASLRDRLQHIKKQNARRGLANEDGQARKSDVSRPTREAFTGDRSEASSSEEGSDTSNTRHRSKHAPAMMSSKRQVTRKRQIIDIPKRLTRDPRFDALRQQSSATTGNEERAYSFLRDYQKSEMQQLRNAVKTAKTDDDKQILRRKLNSMENQVKAREAKEREREVVRKHRQQEGEQVRKGKTPFFLKKGEIKQRALVEKFQSMKGKDREKLIERRRRKESQKEKRRLPPLHPRVGY